MDANERRTLTNRVQELEREVRRLAAWTDRMWQGIAIMLKAKDRDALTATLLALHKQHARPLSNQDSDPIVMWAEFAFPDETGVTQSIARHASRSGSSRGGESTPAGSPGRGRGSGRSSS